MIMHNKLRKSACTYKYGFWMKTDLNDIAAFLAVARTKNFTRAAAQLGVSQSALTRPFATSKPGSTSGC